MNMIHRFMGCIREYKKPTILTLLCVVGEVAIEVLIPFFTANLVNEIKGGAELSGVVRVGLGLILRAASVSSSRRLTSPKSSDGVSRRARALASALTA